MGIQSSVNALMQQLYTIGAIGAGLREQKKQTKGQEATKNEAQIQTEIAAGQAPMKDGKVDTDWLQKRREEYQKNRINGFYKYAFNDDGTLTKNVGEVRARILENRVKRGFEIKGEDNEFYNTPQVQDYLKSFNDKNARFEAALDTLESSISPELQNKVAEKVARASVEARTDSINKTKSNFDEHTASLIRYYGKGSGNP